MNDITLQEFNFLTKGEQELVLQEYGIPVAEKKLAGSKIILYQLSSFYAEVKFYPNPNFVKKIYPFESTDLLLPYIRDIDISQIFY